MKHTWLWQEQCAELNHLFTTLVYAKPKKRPKKKRRKKAR